MTKNLSAILIGSRATLSVIGFQLLLKLGISVPLVISGDEDPGEDDWRRSLVKAANDAGYRKGETLIVCSNPHHEETLEKVRAAVADIIISLQWRRILRPPLLQLARRGVVNLHNAPLPLLRGCDPFSWAIHDGLERMGVTLHQVRDEGVDSGPILTQRLWPVTPSATAWSLYLDGLREGELLMRETLASVIAGAVEPQYQEARYTTYHPMGQFRFKDSEANWNLPAVTVSAALRSRIFPPFQLPYFQVRGRKVEILGCYVASGRGSAGSVVSVAPFVVAAKIGSVCIERVRVGETEFSGSEFAQSVELKPGEMLG